MVRPAVLRPASCAPCRAHSADAAGQRHCGLCGLIIRALPGCSGSGTSPRRRLHAPLPGWALPSSCCHACPGGFFPGVSFSPLPSSSAPRDQRSGRVHRGIVGRPFHPAVRLGEHRHAFRFGDGEACGGRIVAGHQHDPVRRIGQPAGIEQRGHVRAAARNEHGDPRLLTQDGALPMLRARTRHRPIPARCNPAARR